MVKKESEDKESLSGEKESAAVTGDAAAAAAPVAGLADRDGSLNPGGVSAGAAAVGNGEKTTPAGRANGVVTAVGRPSSGSSVAAR